MADTKEKESDLQARAKAAQKELSLAKRFAGYLEPLGRDGARRVLAEVAEWFGLAVADKANGE